MLCPKLDCLWTLIITMHILSNWANFNCLKLWNLVNILLHIFGTSNSLWLHISTWEERPTQSETKLMIVFLLLKTTSYFTNYDYRLSFFSCFNYLFFFLFSGSGLSYFFFDCGCDFQAKVEEDLSAEELFRKKKIRLAEIGLQLLENPEENIKALKELLQICDDEDQNIVKLGLMSLLAVFKDIIPGWFMLNFIVSLSAYFIIC